MSDSRVSIIIPAYNAQDYIRDALRSALAQTWPNIEILVVDDGSLDRTAEIARSFAGVQVVATEHKGHSAAANLGIASSTGRYVKFLDADDILYPNHVSALLSRIDGSQKDLAISGFRCFTDDVAKADSPAVVVNRNLPAREWLYEALRTDCLLGTTNWLIPRKLIEESGLYDERLSAENDLEFMTRVLLGADQVRFAADAMYFFRCGRPDSVTATSATRSRTSAESVVLSAMLIGDHILAADDTPGSRRLVANDLQRRVYEYYPDHPDLRKSIRRRVSELGGADIIPTGPAGFHFLRPLLGWRMARRIERWAIRNNLNSAARHQRTTSTLG